MVPSTTVKIVNVGEVLDRLNASYQAQHGSRDSSSVSAAARVYTIGGKLSSLRVQCLGHCHEINIRTLATQIG